MYNKSSKAHESLSSRLAAHIHHIVAVGETVKASGRALGVCTHVLEVQPVADVKELGKGAGRGDDVDAVTGRAPDRVLDLRRCIVARAADVVQDVVARLQNLCDRVLVVEDDAGEVAVDSVIEVQHVISHTQGSIGDSATSNDVTRDGERGRDVVTSRLANDTNVWREVFVQGSRQDRSHGLKCSVAGEAAANIQGVHVEAKCSRLVEDKAGVLDSLDESFGVRCA